MRLMYAKNFSILHRIISNKHADLISILSLLSKYKHFSNMAKRLNLKDKMEEINERFTHKNKAALANDLL